MSSNRIDFLPPSLLFLGLVRKHLIDSFAALTCAHTHAAEQCQRHYPLEHFANSDPVELSTPDVSVSRDSERLRTRHVGPEGGRREGTRGSVMPGGHFSSEWTMAALFVDLQLGASHQ